ncbi:AAA family ATPase [Roseomonas sp. AR75]|uniref:bifunctional aminoglycoside phosphotransferase/ATP-binding protein n=1 Tax=Roseomonas sp. AR75 TaxID=2562311 RepID=UPI0010C0154E|nr:AAA family ATPase [Roseomonas sp. AR75]
MTIPAEQEAVAALLARITGAAPIETHISAVYVGQDAALKLKKAVRLPFLDFSTLGARERFCRRELELNQPAAPGIYRDVLPVTRASDGSLALDGEGEAVDWVLRMAPVLPEDFLDRIAARGRLDGALLDAVADAVVALHARAPVTAGVDAPARMRAVLAGNVESCAGTGLDEARVAAIAAALAARIDAAAPLLADRAAKGFVRRCHGDLHLGNLCLWEGRPVAFDALEFDEALARIDVGYDLAFLLMDLDVRLGRAAANRVMNRILARGFDIGMLGALPVWLALRAMVRAHVEARRGGDGAPYLDAAAGYLRPVPPRLVAVGGLQGTGKTWLARALAPALGVAPGALHLRTDEVRKRRAGIAPEERLPESAYAPAESAAVHGEIFAAARATLDAGHSVVVDAVFLDPAMRQAARAAAGPHPFHGFWLEAPMAVLRRRVEGRSHDASDATVAVLERAAQADPGPVDWQRLDSSGDSRTAAFAALALNGKIEA